ncbi:MAG TPA: NmrA family NAD(P)-binding protein [Streptosporangiaceae bacterium]
MDAGLKLVVGATGQAGRAVTFALRARGLPTRVLLRPGSDDAVFLAAGCEVARGDLSEPATLIPALDGVTGIAGFVGVGHDLRTRPGAVEAVEIGGNRNLIAAATAATPTPHFVYLSVLMAERAPYVKPFAAKLDTEQSLRESGLPFTVLRPSNFTQSIVGDFVRNGVASLAGRFPNPTSPISVTDIGEIAARCLSELGPSGEAHDLYGPETASFPEVIKRWSDARGETVRFRSMPLPAFRVVTRLASPVRPLLPVIYTLIRSFNEFDWSGDPHQTQALAGRHLETIEAAARAAGPKPAPLNRGGI